MPSYGTTWRPFSLIQDFFEKLCLEKLGQSEY